MSIEAPEIITQPSVPENYYGMCLSVGNISSGTYIYVGNNKNADMYKVIEINKHEDMWYLTVIDQTSYQFTLRYPINARVSVAF